MVHGCAWHVNYGPIAYSNRLQLPQASNHGPAPTSWCAGSSAWQRRGQAWPQGRASPQAAWQPPSPTRRRNSRGSLIQVSVPWRWQRSCSRWYGMATTSCRCQEEGRTQALRRGASEGGWSIVPATALAQRDYRCPDNSASGSELSLASPAAQTPVGPQHPACPARSPTCRGRHGCVTCHTAPAAPGCCRGCTFRAWPCSQPAAGCPAMSCPTAHVCTNNNRIDCTTSKTR